MYQAVSNRQFANKRFSLLNDERCWHVRERSPSRCDRSFCRFPRKIQCLANRLDATFGWRALTDVPTSLIIQLRKPPVSKPPVRHSLNVGNFLWNFARERKVRSCTSGGSMHVQRQCTESRTPPSSLSQQVRGFLSASAAVALASEAMLRTWFTHALSWKVENYH